MVLLNKQPESEIGSTDKKDVLRAEPAVEEEQNMCVVRVTTSVWRDSRGAHLKKSLHFLERQCNGFSMLEEDGSMTGVEEEITPKIINLNSVSDGMYRVEKGTHYQITMYWHELFADKWEAIPSEVW